MVRLITVIACMALLFSCGESAAQSRSGATKGGAGGKGVPALDGARGQAGTSARPVSRSEPENEDAGRARVAEPRTDTQTPPEAQGQEVAEPIDPVLLDLLQQWSAASARIDRLQGRHTRLTYDSVFEVERQSEGEFYYEKVDKGRLEIEPVPITDKLTEVRRKEVEAAKADGRKSGVRTKKNGQPYDLQPDIPGVWCCDGQRVYELDLQKKEAIVAKIPAEMQGVNIMHSPLPFLFGMPPDQARKRFKISFAREFQPKSGKAYLLIEPRTQLDAASWQKASVILDLNEFLPSAVQLLDPAGTSTTVYTFKDIKVNKTLVFAALAGRDPRTRYTPDLRDFNVNNIDNAVPPQIADQNAQPVNGLANVGGLPYEQAIIQLQRQGLVRAAKNAPNNTIILKQGPPATKPELVGTVKGQSPEPGTTLKPGVKVTLEIWDKIRTVERPVERP